MKNNFLALNTILHGKLVIPEHGEHVYITADIWNLSEFIFIPFNAKQLENFSILTNFEEIYLPIPDNNDMPTIARCVITNNLVFTEEDFTWVGDEDNGCWAYYQNI